jgi:hypothetical protein
MILGITLIALAAIGSLALVGLLLSAGSGGTIEVAVLGTLSAQARAVVAAAIAVGATTLLFLGLRRVMDVRRRRALVVHEDASARAAAEEARARLLEMRLDQLQREVGDLEHRNDLLRSSVPVTVPDEPEPDVVALPDAGSL